MELIFGILLLLSIIITIVIYINLNKRIGAKDKEILEIKEKKVNEIKDYFRKEWEQEQTNLQLREQQYGSKLKLLETKLEEKESRYKEVNQDLNLYKEGKIKEIEQGLIEFTDKEKILYDYKLIEYKREKDEEYNKYLSQCEAIKEQWNSELEEIKANLEVERSKRAAINEEILRRRALEEEQDFYRIQIDPNELNDILILRDTAARLRRPEIINKIIWSGYYQKPLAELRKRLLPNGDVSGIYKITRLKTNEVYIGQSTSLDKRWQEHVKSALGVGTLASSQLHRVMREDGPENFTFELLEEVPKEKLRERESYYIDFYDSKNYGLNTLSGDKK